MPGTEKTGQTEEINGVPPAAGAEENYEAEAREKGWKPEEEYKGAKGGFVSAEEFLKREPLFERIKDQSKELKSVKRSLDAMTSQFKTQVDAQVALQVKHLKAQKTEAIKAGNVAQVEEIETAITQAEQTTAPAVGEPDEVVEWIGNNQWFEENEEMKLFAMAHNKTYVEKHKNASISDSLTATEKAVKKAFPEEFAPPKKEEKMPTAPNPVEGGTVPKDEKGKNNYSVARLSEEQKTVYNQMVTRSKVLKHDEFFAGLEEIGELA